MKKENIIEFITSFCIALLFTIYVKGNSQIVEWDEKTRFATLFFCLLFVLIYNYIKWLKNINDEN